MSNKSECASQQAFLASGKAQARRQKGRCPRGVSAQMGLGCVERIGDSHSMDTPQRARLAQTHLDGNDAYSALLDTLLHRDLGSIEHRGIKPLLRIG